MSPFPRASATPRAALSAPAASFAFSTRSVSFDVCSLQSSEKATIGFLIFSTSRPPRLDLDWASMSMSGLRFNALRASSLPSSSFIAGGAALYIGTQPTSNAPFTRPGAFALKSDSFCTPAFTSSIVGPSLVFRSFRLSNGSLIGLTSRDFSRGFMSMLAIASVPFSSVSAICNIFCGNEMSSFTSRLIMGIVDDMADPMSASKSPSLRSSSRNICSRFTPSSFTVWSFDATCPLYHFAQKDVQPPASAPAPEGSANVFFKVSRKSSTASTMLLTMSPCPLPAASLMPSRVSTSLSEPFIPRPPFFPSSSFAAALNAAWSSAAMSRAEESSKGSQT
mmetsp:Transcript_85606/g.239070  ORF Transcript_85606/g.239070 Transcript_85606/m.239070 type:complete len:336 (+) Transcript_85606:154-1161(+)